MGIQLRHIDLQTTEQKNKWQDWFRELKMNLLEFDDSIFIETVTSIPLSDHLHPNLYSESIYEIFKNRKTWDDHRVYQAIHGFLQLNFDSFKNSIKLILQAIIIGIFYFVLKYFNWTPVN